jgi:hypothetical protein
MHVVGVIFAVFVCGGIVLSILASIMRKVEETQAIRTHRNLDVLRNVAELEVMKYQALDTMVGSVVDQQWQENLRKIEEEDGKPSVHGRAVVNMSDPELHDIIWKGDGLSQMLGPNASQSQIEQVFRDCKRDFSEFKLAKSEWMKRHGTKTFQDIIEDGTIRD